MYEFLCKKDCVYCQSGSCSLKIDPVQSIFSNRPPVCLYYNRAVDSAKNTERISPAVIL